MELIEDTNHHLTPEEMCRSQDPSQGLNPFIPPFWTQQYEWEGLDREAYQAWEQRLNHIPAWKSGIDTIIVLPAAGISPTDSATSTSSSVNRTKRRSGQGGQASGGGFGNQGNTASGQSAAG
ncbi:hypothetical protein [Arthrobacter humicola]